MAISKSKGNLATLILGKTYHLSGVLFERDVPQVVDDTVADICEYDLYETFVDPYGEEVEKPVFKVQRDVDIEQYKRMTTEEAREARRSRLKYGDSSEQAASVAKEPIANQLKRRLANNG